MQELQAMVASSNRNVKPVLAKGQVLGGKDCVLKAVDIQELNSVDENGRPILMRVRKDDVVLLEGDKPPYPCAIIKEVLWVASKKDVNLKVTQLYRVQDVEGLTSTTRYREVYFSEDTLTVPARRMVQPCKVFFLLSYKPPVMMADRLGTMVEWWRQGYLCWEHYDKAQKRVTPLSDLEGGTALFAEIARLLQKTNAELRQLEERENVAPGKRTAPLPDVWLANLPAPSGPLSTSLSKDRSKRTVPKEPVAKAKEEATSKPGEPAVEEAGPRPCSEAAEEVKSAANNIAMVLELGAISNSAWGNIGRYIDALLRCAGRLAQAAEAQSGQQKLLPAKQEVLDAARKELRAPAPATAERLGKAFRAAPKDVQAKLTDHSLHRVLGAWLSALPPASPAAAKIALLRALRSAPFSEDMDRWLVHWGIWAHVASLAEGPQASVKAPAAELKEFWEKERVNTREPVDQPPDQTLPPADRAAEAVDASSTDEDNRVPIAVALERRRSAQAALSPLAAKDKSAETAADNAARLKGRGGQAAGLAAEAQEEAGSRPGTPTLPRTSGAVASTRQAEPLGQSSSGAGKQSRLSSAAPSSQRGSSGKHKGPDGTAARKMRNLNELHKRCPPAPPLKGTATEAAEITSSPTQRLRGAASGAAVQTSDIGRASRELTTEAAASTDGGFAKREGRDEGIADSPMNTTDHPDKGPANQGERRTQSRQQQQQQQRKAGERSSPGRPSKRKDVASQKAGPTGSKRVKTGSGEAIEVPVEEQSSSESEQLDASREGSQAGKAGSSAPDTAKVAGPPREADRGNAGAPAPPTPPTLIQVYAGVGKRRRSAHFDVASSRVIIESNGKSVSMDPQEFCTAVNRKSHWEATIYVTGSRDDGTVLSIGEWLAGRCSVCDLPLDEANMLMCSNEACEKMYHIYCLKPPLEKLPPEDQDWYCPSCQAIGVGS